LLLLCLVAPPRIQATIAADEVSTLWERAIAAKGGRERLHAVESVAISGVSGGAQDEALLVLPSKLWDWNDERPTVFGLWLQVTDLDRGWSQFVSENSGDPLAPGKPTDAMVEQIRMIQVLTFMETRWVRPNLDGARTIRPVFRRLPVIDAHVQDQRYEFQLDPKTFLPKRIVVRTPAPPRNVPFDEPYTMEEVYTLGAYREVAGLQLPHEISGPIGRIGPRIVKWKYTYELNVEYDPQIFRTPPSLAGGRKAWRLSKR
jgi:hypothetical protein